MTAAQNLRFTPEQYLAEELKAEFRSEYIEGHIVAMAGGSIRHSLVGGNIIRALGNALVGSPCVVLTSDVRVRIETADRYTYPDVTVICGDIKVDPRNADTVCNPKLIVEVLSPSTAAYDRGHKFAAYRTLPALDTYILVDPDAQRIERYERGAEGWLLTDHNEGELPLPGLGVSILVDEVFAGVEALPKASAED